ncbi:OmpG porin family protein [Orbus wheelerorum]|uniref:OmpG porin family protein n=1 Tax=Orbus wheelerorum TaxID=3074111 RepID=UPI00370D063E
MSVFSAMGASRYEHGYQSYFNIQNAQSTTEKEITKTKPISAASQIQANHANINKKNSKNTTASDIKKNNIDTVAKSTSSQIQRQDSLFISNPNEAPVAWLSVNNNLNTAALHGNIRSQIEIDNFRWNHDKERNSGKYKFSIMNAFLRHDELPNWYFGFYFAKEDSYKGNIFDQSFQDNTNISEAFVGHIFETYRGKIGLEGMFGAESGLNRLKTRVKTWVDLRFTDTLRLGGYIFYEFQPYNNRPDNGDTNNTSIETEPVLKYQIDNNNGLWLSSLYIRKKQARKEFGAIMEVEQNIRLGFFHNWTDLFSSIYIGTGRLKKYNQINSNETFYKSNYHTLGVTASYPLILSLRAYGEFKFEKTKEYGLWTSDGHNWNPFTLLGVVYEF